MIRDTLNDVRVDTTKVMVRRVSDLFMQTDNLAPFRDSAAFVFFFNGLQESTVIFLIENCVEMKRARCTRVAQFGTVKPPAGSNYCYTTASRNIRPHWTS